MPARLLALDDGLSYVLDKPIMLVGRHQDCDIQIESRKISRRHCCIAELDGYLIVRDLGSTNGLLINGVKKDEGRLRAGDELTISNLRFRVQWEEKSPNGRKSPAAAADGTLKELENDESRLPLPEDSSSGSSDHLAIPLAE